MQDHKFLCVVGMNSFNRFLAVFVHTSYAIVYVLICSISVFQNVARSNIDAKHWSSLKKFFPPSFSAQAGPHISECMVISDELPTCFPVAGAFFNLICVHVLHHISSCLAFSHMPYLSLCVIYFTTSCAKCSMHLCLRDSAYRL